MKKQNRRQFIQKAAYLPVLSLAACRTLSDQSTPLESEKPSSRIRRNLWSLTPRENGLEDYEKAVKILKELPPSDYRSWINLAAIHRDSCPHGNSFFLPWHRAYLDFFEQICTQVLNKPFALPYWNWTENSKLHPLFLDSQSSLYHPRRDLSHPDESLQTRFQTFVPNAEDPWNGYAMEKIQNAPNFINYLGRAKSLANVRIPDQIRAQRQAGFGTTEGAVAGSLESGAHNLTHVFVGGDMGDLMSPLDPLFWVHHSNIDRLWTEWSYKHPGKMLPLNGQERTYWLNFQLIGLFYGTKLPNVFETQGPYTVAFTRTVNNMLSTDRLGYQYDSTDHLGPFFVSTTEASSKTPFVLEIETRGLTPQVNKNVISFSIALSERGFATIEDMLKRFEGRNYEDASLSLQAIGLPEPDTKRGMIEFYIDHPSLTPPALRTSRSPYFVGRVGFFGHSTHDGILSTSLDLAPVITQLRQIGWQLTREVKLQIVTRGKIELKAPQFNTTKLRLEYIEFPRS
jgi:hypothetical protein